jgi:hypothetical protein
MKMSKISKQLYTVPSSASVGSTNSASLWKDACPSDAELNKPGPDNVSQLQAWRSFDINKKSGFLYKTFQKTKKLVGNAKVSSDDRNLLNSQFLLVRSSYKEMKSNLKSVASDKNCLVSKSGGAFSRNVMILDVDNQLVEMKLK